MTQVNTTNTRIAFADYAKLIGTFLVVLGHITHPYDRLSLFIYSFHMPLFFFISGMFFKVCSLNDEIKKTTNRIIIPTLIYLTISFIYIGGLYPEHSFVSLFWSSILGLFKGGTITVNPVCWFFFPLINLRILTNIWFNKKWLSITLLVLGLLSFYKNIFYIAQTELAFPFFLFGYYMKGFLVRESKKDFSVNRSIIIPFLLLGVCELILYFNGRMNMGLVLLGSLPYGLNVIAYFISGVSGTIALIFFSFIFKNSNKYVLSASNALITCVGLQFLFFESFDHYYCYGICVIFSIIIISVCIIIHKILSCILPSFFRWH